MDYVLVGDECDSCRYVTNAFTLLRLPLRAISATDFRADLIENTNLVFICNQLDAEHTDKITKALKSTEACLISWGRPSCTKVAYSLNIPFSDQDLKNTLLHATHFQEHTADLDNPIFEKLVGESSHIRQIKTLIKQVAQSDTTVLILGESGTGKDVIASCIHHLSDRKDHLFVPINCGAIPGELMESELFGHEKGAFTGALTRRPGRFEMANGGTLFLDEIGDMPLLMQVKLLRVIQDRKVERVGGNVSIEVNARLIAATNKDLSDLILHKQFREDLYYRLNVLPIHVPSLRERHEDIPMIIDYQLEHISQRLKHRVMFTERATEILCHYPWPGNIRELQNFLERMVILHPDEVVDEKDIDAMYKQHTQKPAARRAARSTAREKNNKKETA